MRKSNPSDQEQALADRLRGEAAQSRAEFSESLHGRLCRAVLGPEATKPAADPASVSRWLSRHGLVTALAVAGALAIAVIAWQRATDDGQDRRIVRPPESDMPVRPSAPAAPDEARAPTEVEIVTGLLDQATEELADMVASTETQPHWGYLDQNAERALAAFNRSVPLDAVASLVFGDATADAFSESLDP